MEVSPTDYLTLCSSVRNIFRPKDSHTDAGEIVQHIIPTVNARIAGPGYPLRKDPEWNGFRDWYNLYFGSHHPGFCQFVFGDGHVRALDVTISTTVLGYMATKSDDDIVPHNAL